MTVAALLPIKHESERVPGKNFRLLGPEKRLFEHMLGTLLSIETIDHVRINTDSPDLADFMVENDRVKVVARPDHLLGHRTPMTDIIAWDCGFLAQDLVVQVHATSPFLSSKTISQAISQVERGEVDSVFGVNLLQSRLYWEDMTAINHDPELLLPTQDLPVVYEENSSIYVFSRELGLEGSRIGDRPGPLPISPLEAIDIDTEDDWNWAVAQYELLSPARHERRRS